MKIVIAPDSFKESLPANEVAEAIKRGFKRVIPDAECLLLPVGDGGEGTVNAIKSSLDLEEKTVQVTGPFGDEVQIRYYEKGELALFEVVDLIGLEKIPNEKRYPLEIQTKGIGQLILHFIDRGVKDIYIGVGGTASNDGGIGIAAGIGYQFYDENGNELQACGQSLSAIRKISKERVIEIPADVHIRILADVTNPLCGPRGATYTFGKQKGLKPYEFEEVDEAIREFYENIDPDVFMLEGAGAGGGIAAGLCVFAGAEIVSGIQTCLDLINFDEKVADADLIIVGEGRLDSQSLAGKAPIGVAKRTPKGVPVIAICGSLDQDLPSLPFENIIAAFSILEKSEPLENSLKNAATYLEHTAASIAQILSLKKN